MTEMGAMMIMHRVAGVTARNAMAMEIITHDHIREITSEGARLLVHSTRFHRMVKHKSKLQATKPARLLTVCLARSLQQSS